MQKISTLLREARESKELSIKDAAKALKLRERHIKMLEDGELTELSREIYLKGFLKTYTKWLNVDGGEILAQVNKEKKKIVTQRNTVPVMAIGFSYISDLARRPGLNVFLLSTILTAIIYVFWYSNHRNMSGADMISALENMSGAQQVSTQYSNVLEEYRGKDLVLFSHDGVEIKLLDTDSGVEKTQTLADGDVLFIKINDNTVLSTDTPDVVDVLLDKDGQQEPIGTLDKILIGF